LRRSAHAAATHIHTRMHAHAHARTHARTHLLLKPAEVILEPPRLELALSDLAAPLGQPHVLAPLLLILALLNLAHARAVRSLKSVGLGREPRELLAEVLGLGAVLVLQPLDAGAHFGAVVEGRVDDGGDGADVARDRCVSLLHARKGLVFVGEGTGRRWGGWREGGTGGDFGERKEGREGGGENGQRGDGGRVGRAWVRLVEAEMVATARRTTARHAEPDPDLNSHPHPNPSPKPNLRCLPLYPPTPASLWYGMVWCPSYPLGRNRCDQVVASGPGAS
jgi:hypothetical protein